MSSRALIKYVDYTNTHIFRFLQTDFIITFKREDQPVSSSRFPIHLKLFFMLFAF
jgi:hypothetical protein